MFWEFRYYEVKILSHFSDLKNERERELRRVSARNFFVKTQYCQNIKSKSNRETFSKFRF